MKDEEKPILEALAARFYCIKALLMAGKTDNALSVIDQCISVLPEPTINSIDAAFDAAKRTDPLLSIGGANG